MISDHVTIYNKQKKRRQMGINNEEYFSSYWIQKDKER